MQRYPLNKYDRFYNEGEVYQAVPIHRSLVVPGQTLNVEANVKFQSAAFSANVLSNAFFEVEWFYCPIRLVWDDWMSWISEDDDYSGTFPSTSTVWWKMFDLNNSRGNFSAIPRRCYKLIYNEYYGDDDMEAPPTINTWYNDITADTETTMCRLKTTEQFGGGLIFGGSVDEPTHSVTGNEINLMDFDRDLKHARRARSKQVTGDKYVDALKAQGVTLDWKIRMAPEKLHRQRIIAKPVKTFNTGDTAQGQATVRYEGTVNCAFGDKRFSEHGYLIGIAMLRPHLFNTGYPMPPEAMFRIQDKFFVGGNNYQAMVLNEKFVALASNTDEMYCQNYHHILKGIHMVAGANIWANDVNCQTGEEAAYPPAVSLPTSSELGTNDFAVVCEQHSGGMIPIKPNQV